MSEEEQGPSDGRPSQQVKPSTVVRVLGLVLAFVLVFVIGQVSGQSWSGAKTPTSHRDLARAAFLSQQPACVQPFDFKLVTNAVCVSSMSEDGTGGHKLPWVNITDQLALPDNLSADAFVKANRWNTIANGLGQDLLALKMESVSCASVFINSYLGFKMSPRAHGATEVMIPGSTKATRMTAVDPGGHIVRVRRGQHIFERFTDIHPSKDMMIGAHAVIEPTGKKTTGIGHTSVIVVTVLTGCSVPDAAAARDAVDELLGRVQVRDTGCIDPTEFYRYEYEHEKFDFTKICVPRLDRLDDDRTRLKSVEAPVGAWFRDGQIRYLVRFGLKGNKYRPGSAVDDGKCTFPNTKSADCYYWEKDFELPDKSQVYMEIRRSGKGDLDGKLKKLRDDSHLVKEPS